jgi:hypothetical protein
MTFSIKHFFIPVMLLLVACGQGQDQQTSATTATEQTAVTPLPAPDVQAVTATTPVEPSVQMDHSMHGMDHSMTVPVHANIGPAESNNGLFRASVISEMDPVVINQLHKWTLSLTTADGSPVEDATIAVTGNMPAHAHGMPTSPQVTANLGGGNYTVEGMQFQMGGEWEVIFNVSSGTQTDDVVFRFTLQ